MDSYRSCVFNLVYVVYQECTEQEAIRLLFGINKGKIPGQSGSDPLARESLKQLDAAENLNDMLIPSSNRLERLSGDRMGQHSIRINLQTQYDLEMAKISAPENSVPQIVADGVKVA